MKESLIQAYSNSPRRQKLQILGGVFIALVLGAMMLILYLIVSARVVSMGRQLQQAKDDIDQLVYQSVNYSYEIDRLMRFDRLQVRADEMGFRAPYPGEVFYVPVPGYPSAESPVVETAAGGLPAVVNVNLKAYHQTLLQWVGEQLAIFFRPFRGL